MNKIFIVWFTIALIALYGYINNIAQLARANFEAPYKNEVVRAVGVAIPVMGAVVGFIDMED